jgi:AIPR protein
LTTKVAVGKLRKSSARARRSAGPTNDNPPHWLAAYEARTDLATYGDNSLGLFALALRFRIEDLESVAANSITDGNDDKKCDVIYIDKDEGKAIIAQCYRAATPKDAAPSNKASDLNTAVSWVLQRPLHQLPEKIRSASEELRVAILAGQITSLNLWYIHNCKESKNVAEELKTLSHTTSSIIKNHYKDQDLAVSVLEVGSGTFERWYRENLSPILVNEEFSVRTTSSFQISGPEWKAIVAPIPAQFLRRVYEKHKTNIFSANIRDYLGSRQSDSNINNGIKTTAAEDPANFWVFNNGVTILCHKVSAKVVKSGTNLHLTGMSIVNGAQTTGALGSLEKPLPASAKVLARFVETGSTTIVQNIIRFNNSQNKISASDFRSTDATQKRLKDEMNDIPHAEYEGGRRGGYGDAIKRRANLLASLTVGQALAAFHGDAVVAYNQKSDIWINDRLYGKYFQDDTSARHIVLSYSLLKCIEHIKLELVQKSRTAGELTSLEEEQLKFFRQRGAIYLFVAAVASCMETFLQRRIPNMFALNFKKNKSPDDAILAWMPVVKAIAPLCSQLSDALADGLKNSVNVSTSINRFKSLVAVTAVSNSDNYKIFAANVAAT